MGSTAEDQDVEESAAAEAGGNRSIELAIVIPTFNERDNIIPLHHRLIAALDGIAWEAIFVDDDSPDGTAELVRDIAQRDPRIRVISRIGRRGLASACVEGALSSSAPYFAVMDADMQHDERILPQMLERLNKENLDIVVATRNLEDGSTAKWESRRWNITRLATRAANFLLKVELRDPMSGFFLMRRRTFDQVVHNLSQQGFKILLDVMASAPQSLRGAEISYHFRPRRHGESKLDSMAVWEYGMLLADKIFGHIVPPRLLFFGMVGGFGLLVHMATLGAALFLGLAFAVSQTIAAVASIGSNFILNNLITYHDMRLKRWDFARGFLIFYVICSIGLAGNVSVALLIYAEEPIWWLAGLPGAIIGVVWNYAVSSFFVWGRQ